MARRWTLAALALLAVIAAVLWIPWAVKDRVVIAATPVPPPIFSITPAPLKGGSTACMQQVTFTPQTQIAEIGLTTGGKPGPPLAITATAPGYRATAKIAAGYHDDPAARFQITAPPRDVIGQLCIKNTGRTAISLNGTNEFRTLGRPTLVVDGVQQPEDAKLVFYARVRSSYASRIGEIFGHAATFTPAFFSKAVLILIGLMALAGIPLAIAWALAAAQRADDPADD
jgi:hypothetical protein